MPTKTVPDRTCPAFPVSLTDHRPVRRWAGVQVVQRRPSGAATLDRIRCLGGIAAGLFDKERAMCPGTVRLAVGSYGRRRFFRVR
jgi:hypothetical protein